MINDVLPEFVSLALDRDTNGQQVTAEDLACLERCNIATRWVGSRAVAYDGFPTYGNAYDTNNNPVDNAFIITHLGSGGGAFAPASATVCCEAEEASLIPNPLVIDVLKFARSNRTANTK